MAPFLVQAPSFLGHCLQSFPTRFQTQFSSITETCIHISLDYYKGLTRINVENNFTNAFLLPLLYIEIL